MDSFDFSTHNRSGHLVNRSPAIARRALDIEAIALVADEFGNRHTAFAVERLAAVNVVFALAVADVDFQDDVARVMLASQHAPKGADAGAVDGAGNGCAVEGANDECFHGVGDSFGLGGGLRG